MNNSTAKLIRKFVNPETPISKKVYRRFKKEYAKFNKAQKTFFKIKIRAELSK